MQADVLALFRKFRHDLLNELQIASGHLQLGRPVDVLRKDVQAVIERIQELSLIFSCQNDQLAVLLWSWLEQARDLELSVSFEVTTLPCPSAEVSPEQISHLVAALLAQIVALDDEERWLHVRVDGAQSAVLITAPLLPLEKIAATLPIASQAVCCGADEDLEFALHLAIS